MLQMEGGNSSNGKRLRGNDNERQGSLKRMKMSSVQKVEVVDLEEVEVQTCPNDKATRTPQFAIDAKLSPDGGSNVCGSKPSENRSPSESPIYGRRKWSDDQEICLMNAILETRKPNGEVNWAAFYKLARQQLRVGVSNPKLYEKMKNMKTKFRSMVKERQEGKLKMQTAHQHTMYLLWEKLWGTFESERANPEKKETESSRPNEMEVENLNSAKNSSSPREDTLSPNSAKYLKNRENRAIDTSFAEASEFRENSAINAVNLDSIVNVDFEVNPNFAANPNIMENKDKLSLQEETHGENANPDFTASTKHTEIKVERSLRKETQGENLHIPEESIHQNEETRMENARVNGHRVNDHFVDKSPHQEIHVGNAREIGHVVDCSGLQQIQFRGLESRIEKLIENSIKGIETRLEASIQKSLEASVQNLVSRAVTAAASVSAAAVFYMWTYLIKKGTS